jgi:hypothetical protein
MNNHPLHFDAVYAAKTEFGKPLVNSCLTLSIVVGMSVSGRELQGDQPRLDRHQAHRAGVRRRHAHAESVLASAVAVAPDAGHRDRPHPRREAGWHGVHHLLVPKTGHAVDDAP